MVAGAGRTILSFIETVDLLGFPQSSVRFIEKKAGSIGLR